jgi:glycine oxidase
VDALERESETAIDFRRSGAIEVAFDEGEAKILNERAALRGKLGIRSETATHLGLPARYYPDDAVVDPRHVTAALLEACRRRGVLLHEHEPVLAVAPDGKSVRTAQGEYSDAGVLIAAGAWSSGLLPGLPRTIPVRGHLISWSLAPGTLGPILRNGPTYLLQRRTGVLIAGASMERAGFDRSLDETAIGRIRANAARLLPALAALAPGDRWNGFRPGIEGEAPAIGRVPGTAIWTAFGHFRNGILMAPETALRIAAMIE